MWEGGYLVPAESEISTSHTELADYLAAPDLVGTQPVTTSGTSWQQHFSIGQLPNCGAAEFQEADNPAPQHCRGAAFQHYQTTP